MGVVEVDLAHPAKAGEHPGQLGPKHWCQLIEPDRQLAVRAGVGGVDHRMVGAIGGTQYQLVTADPDRREHLRTELLPVPRAFEE